MIDSCRTCCNSCPLTFTNDNRYVNISGTGCVSDTSGEMDCTFNFALSSATASGEGSYLKEYFGIIWSSKRGSAEGESAWI